MQSSPHLREKDYEIFFQSTHGAISNVRMLEPAQAKYYLSILTMFRNEERFLKEWIDYYRVRGVEHFYLFNHLSAVHPEKALGLYIKQGLVGLVHCNKATPTLRALLTSNIEFLWKN